MTNLLRVLIGSNNGGSQVGGAREHFKSGPIKHPSPSIISYSVTQSSRSIFFPLPRREFIIFACPFFGDSGVLDLLSFTRDERTGDMILQSERFMDQAVVRISLPVTAHAYLSDKEGNA